MGLSESANGGFSTEINSAIAQLNQVALGLRQEIARFQVKTEYSGLTPQQSI
ncbi:MAG: hypothetical protein V7K53_10050 [Nostoc sp.]|uniref:hypothetical protein n=1 Tax=Nostoc sp. TaxID=1180 RepID=UPI002FF83DA7